MSIDSWSATCLFVCSSMSLSLARFTTPNVAGPFSNPPYLKEKDRKILVFPHTHGYNYIDVLHK